LFAIICSYFYTAGNNPITNKKQMLYLLEIYELASVITRRFEVRVNLYRKNTVVTLVVITVFVLNYKLVYVIPTFSYEVQFS